MMEKNKKKRRKDKKVRRQSKASNSGILMGRSYWVSYLPVVLTLLITPLIVRAVEYHNVLSQFPWNGGISYEVDLFLRGKGTALFLMAGLAVFLALCMLLMGRRFHLYSMWVLLPLFYLLLAFISSVFSDYREISFGGAQDLHQHFPVLACYIILFYYTFFITGRDVHEKSGEENERAVSFILKGFLILSLLLCCVGLLQLVGKDPFKWVIISRLCGLDEVSFVPSSRIYMTLYHPDYVGVMTVMLIPMILAGCFIEKKKYVRIIYGITAVLLFVCLLASQTRSGIIALVLAVCVALVFFIWKTIVYKGFAVKGSHMLLGISILVILIILAVFVDHVLLKGALFGRLFRFSEDYTFTDKGITGIETGDEDVRIVIDGKSYILSWESDHDLEILDGDQKKLQFTPCTDEDYEKVKKALKKEKVVVDISQKDIKLLKDSHDSSVCYLIRTNLEDKKGGLNAGYAVCDGSDVWLIIKDPDGDGYRLLNRQGKPDQSIISKDAFPQSFYGFASFRGHIWSKTMAKLGSVALIGTGPDTFALYFPNNDYVSRHRTGQDELIVNKPHCWFLQMAAETGIISALLIIVYLLYFFIITLKTESVNLKEKEINPRIILSDSPDTIMALASALSVFTYVVAGLANDSMVVCAPVFWIILGYGSALIFRNLDR